MIAPWQEHFGLEPVPPWLVAFDRDPGEAVDALLAQRFFLGLLEAAEPEDLVADWAQMLGEDFVPRLDAALAGWVERRWGSPAESRGAARLADTWSILCGVAVYVDGLERTGAALRARFAEAFAYLGPLSTGPSRDPLGRYLGAVAAYQNDRSLAPFWWRLCDLSEGTPFYHARYAIEGLSGLPAEDGRDGGFRPEVARGVARLANALRRLAESGRLEERRAKEELLAIGRLALTAFPFPARWREVLSQELVQQTDEGEWLAQLVPGLRKGVRETSTYGWADRSEQIARSLKAGRAGALHEAQQLLDDQRRHASATGNSFFLVRSLCRFASSVWDHRPEQAVAWAEEALAWEPWDDYSWNTLTKGLVKAGRLGDALEIAGQAAERFPEAAVARCTLGDVLRRAGRLEEAESIYRETIELFPDDDVAPCGLAEVLREARRLAEAEWVYRAAIARFRQDPVPRNGLAEVLKQAGRWQEAVAVYEETVKLFPTNEFARNRLQATLRALERGEASRSAPEDRPERLDLISAGVRVNAARLLRRSARRSAEASEEACRRAAELVDSVLAERPHDLRALGEKGLLLLESGRPEESRALLGRQSALLPAAPTLLAALARAEREQAAAEHRLLAAEAEEDLLEAPHRLRALGRTYDPLVALQEGRAYLALTDGDVRRQRARVAFGRLLALTRRQEKEGKGFDPWWSRAVTEAALAPLAGQDEVRPEDVDSLDAWQRLHDRRLDLLEEDFAIRQLALQTGPLPVLPQIPV